MTLDDLDALLGRFALWRWLRGGRWVHSKGRGDTTFWWRVPDGAWVIPWDRWPTPTVERGGCMRRSPRAAG